MAENLKQSKDSILAKKKKKFFVKLGIFWLKLGKNILFGIGNGGGFRPQNRVIESPEFYAQ